MRYTVVIEVTEEERERMGLSRIRRSRALACCSQQEVSLRTAGGLDDLLIRGKLVDFRAARSNVDRGKTHSGRWEQSEDSE